MIDNHWLIAAIAVGVGLATGVVGGAWLRHSLQKETNRSAIREIAGPASLFLFWLASAAGVIVAMATLSPETLKPLPRQILNWLPNVIAAGLVLLVGYAVAAAASRSIARAFERATGNRSRLAERTLRAAIIAGSAVLALGQLGVETTILIVLTAGVVFSAGLTAALLGGLGGRAVAQSIAAGRALSPHLREGRQIRLGTETYTIVELRPATAVLQSTALEQLVISYTALFDAPFHTPAPTEDQP